MQIGNEEYLDLFSDLFTEFYLENHDRYSNLDEATSEFIDVYMDMYGDDNLEFEVTDKTTEDTPTNRKNVSKKYGTYIGSAVGGVAGLGVAELAVTKWKKEAKQIESKMTSGLASQSDLQKLAELKRKIRVARISGGAVGAAAYPVYNAVQKNFSEYDDLDLSSIGEYNFTELYDLYEGDEYSLLGNIGSYAAAKFKDSVKNGFLGKAASGIKRFNRKLQFANDKRELRADQAKRGIKATKAIISGGTVFKSERHKDVLTKRLNHKNDQQFRGVAVAKSKIVGGKVYSNEEDAIKAAKRLANKKAREARVEKSKVSTEAPKIEPTKTKEETKTTSSDKKPGFFSRNKTASIGAGVGAVGGLVAGQMISKGDRDQLRMLEAKNPKTSEDIARIAQLKSKIRNKRLATGLVGAAIGGAAGHAKASGFFAKKKEESKTE